MAGADDRDRYTELVHTHFQHSVLDSLPEWLRKMDDTYGDGLSMGQSWCPVLQREMHLLS